MGGTLDGFYVMGGFSYTHKVQDDSYLYMFHSKHEDL